MDKETKKKSQSVVEVTDNGPLKITGNFIIQDLKRDEQSSPCEVYLCRCGRSADKPYCDGSHRR